MELNDIQSYFGAGVPNRTRKDEIVRRLGAYIIEKPKEWLRRMLERDLRLLKMLVDKGPEVPVSLGYPDYPSVLETVRLLDSDVSDERFRKVSISKEFYEITAPYVESAIREGERSGRFQMERAALGYLNLYGVMTIREFITFMLEYRETLTPRHRRNFVDELWNSPVIKLCHCDSTYMLSPNIAEPDAILKGREEFKEIRNLKHFSPEEAIMAGTNAPYFRFGMDAEEGRNMTETLEFLGYKADEIIVEEHDLWMNSQLERNSENAEAVFSSVIKKQDEFRSFEDYTACMQTVAAYSNSLPKWLLRGYSPNEVNFMKIVLKTETDPLKELEKQNPAFGMYVHPVGPDDPCPCGSGLSYRHCHGKFLS